MFPQQRGNERRKTMRYALTGTLPGVFKNRNIHVVTVDVSSKGLGLLMDPAPQPKEIVELELEAPVKMTLRFQIRWCLAREEFASIQGFDNLKRCGLMLLDNHDLVDILSRFDCLQIEE